MILKTDRKGWHNFGDQGSADVLILGPLQTERNPEPLTFSETRPDKQDTFVFVFCPSSLPQLFAIVLWQQEVTRVNQTTHKYHPMPYSYNSVQNIYVNLFKIRNKTLLADNLLGNISLILGGKENHFFFIYECLGLYIITQKSIYKRSEPVPVPKNVKYLLSSILSTLYFTAKKAHKFLTH